MITIIRLFFSLGAFFLVQSAVDAIAKHKSYRGILILCDQLKNEKDPRALFGLAKACRIRNAYLRDSLVEFLQRKDLTYRGKAAALESLGFQCDPRDLTYLLQIVQDKNEIGLHSIIRSGALRALGRHRSMEGFKYLMTRLPLGLEPERARAAIIDGLAASAGWQERRYLKEVIEVISDSLRDTNLNVRWSCASALVQLEATEKATELERSKPNFAEQDWPYLERKVHTLRTSSPNDKCKELQKNIEDLETKLKKLEDKISEREAKEKAEKQKVDVISSETKNEI